jgi:hypothetical protein
LPNQSERMRRKAAVEDAYRRGFFPPFENSRSNSAIYEAGRILGGVPGSTISAWYHTELRLKNSGKENFLPDETKFVDPTPPEIQKPPSPFAIDHRPAESFTTGPVITLMSRPDNTFLFGAAGDLHAASKHCRWDVRSELYQTFIEEGAQCNFDTGNWIDGEASFNRYDLEVHGLDAQCRMLARNHPRGLKTYAVWGDDHEGWYVQREGVDVGRYNESIMREAGHDWTDLGFMEAHVVLKNANSGKTASMTVVHPGGGSAYALSYSIQKIIESYEGGEKPAVGLYGHYHKLWSGVIRNVFVLQTACQQDQTPFMRKKRLEAHVGGALVKLRQDPRTGAIASMTPELMRWFTRDFHAGAGRWSRHGPVKQLPRDRAGVIDAQAVPLSASASSSRSPPKRKRVRTGRRLRARPVGRGRP